MKPHTHTRLMDQIQTADSPIKLMAVIIGKYGLIGGIAAFLIWNMASKQTTAIERTGDLIQSHVYETRYMQRASCVSLAILAGTPATLCDPPSSAPMPPVR